MISIKKIDKYLNIYEMSEKSAIGFVELKQP